MYLLYNKRKRFIKNICVSFLIIILQAYMPKIWLLPNYEINIDILLIYLTFLVFSTETYFVIILAFFMGIFQDFVVQVEMLGTCALIKSISIYYIGFSNGFEHGTPPHIVVCIETLG